MCQTPTVNIAMGMTISRTSVYPDLAAPELLLPSIMMHNMLLENRARATAMGGSKGAGASSVPHLGN